MNVMECAVPAANAGTICAETIVYTRAAWDMIISLDPRRFVGLIFVGCKIHSLSVCLCVTVCVCHCSIWLTW